MRVLCVVALALVACTSYQPDEPSSSIRARFDPDAKVIPMPSDALRDDVAGRLDLPVAEAGSAAEAELFTFLNTLDGWSSASAATVDFSGPIAPATVTAETVTVWKWGPTPTPVTDVRVHVADDERRITIDAPRFGWERGAQYYVVVRGGDAGVEGKLGEPVIADAAFYFLRQRDRLDDPIHNRAFPGDTYAERAEVAAQLEELRLELAPMFEFLDGRGLDRAEVAALWRFTVTTRTELAMDKPSQRMPIPIQLLVDPATGRVALPPAPWDTAVEAEAKHRLAAYDGFATSANLLFELTGPADPATIDGDSVELWRLDPPAARLPASARLMADGVHVVVTPASLPLPERTNFAVVVTERVRDRAGAPLVPMPAGALLGAGAPIVEQGASTVPVVPLEDAVRLEDGRGRLAALWAARGRADAVVAWPFQTQTVQARLDRLAATAADLGLSPAPTVVETKTPGQALLDFPLAVSSLLSVDHVVYGTLTMPYFLDDVTRAWREDGGRRDLPVAFTMTVPRGVTAGRPVPVVVFGHGVMTERRFVLAIGDALASKGFAAIAIDLPFHGTRTQCIAGGPISVVDPRTGNLTSLPPCQAGTTCVDGRCVGADGTGNRLAMWPVLNYPVASGAAFLEIEHIANTKDHFDQSVIELSALVRSLSTADWSPLLGAPVDRARIYYAGQSLGGILGATLLSTQPTIARAVLNVPGADLVDMFADSTWFGPQVRGFFTREGIAAGSYEGERFLDVARWIVDAVDPQGVGAATGDRALMLQMASLDAIIPNAYTRTLERVTGAPRRDYVAEHAFLVVPIEPEFLRGGRELAGFLDGSFAP